MVDFCDTAGQKRFHSLGSIYYKKADAAIVVFDRTDSKSLQEGFFIRLQTQPLYTSVANGVFTVYVEIR